MNIGLSFVLILIPSLLRGMHTPASVQPRKEVSFATLINLEHAPCLKNEVDKVLSKFPVISRTSRMQEIHSEIRSDLVKEEALLEYFLLMNGCSTDMKKSEIQLNIIRDLKKKDPAQYQAFAFGIIKDLIEQEHEIRARSLLDSQRRSSPRVNPCFSSAAGELITVSGLHRCEESPHFGNTQPSTPMTLDEQLISQQRTNRVSPVGMEFLSYMVNAVQDALVTSKDKNEFKLKLLVILSLVSLLEGGGLIATGTTRG